MRRSWSGPLDDSSVGGPRGQLRTGMPWGRQGKRPGLASDEAGVWKLSPGCCSGL